MSVYFAINNCSKVNPVVALTVMLTVADAEFTAPLLTINVKLSEPAKPVVGVYVTLASLFGTVG